MNEKTNTNVKGMTITPMPSEASKLAQDEMVFRLKSSIENNNRYKFSLGDMALGLSAATGVTKPEAKKQIEEKFAAKIGQSPYDYLQHCFEQKQDMARGRGRGR